MHQATAPRRTPPGRTPGLKPRTVSSCAASSHRRDLHPPTPPSPAAAGAHGPSEPPAASWVPGDPRPESARGSGYGVLRSWCKIRLFGSSLPPRIYCLWSLLGWGRELRLRHRRGRPAAAVASAVRKAGGSWGSGRTLPPLPAPLPRPLPAETSSAVHLKGTSIMV